ncbi:glutamine amidotransferase [Alienimonas sp. DA493]|uniref:glutamine amidotransferase n=1 Tax=Alienimonas sp. DA493 TaxID=3373605 RepID=UPI00375454B8
MAPPPPRRPTLTASGRREPAGFWDRLGRSLFPPPRGPVRWRDGWPLAAFALLLGGLAVWLTVDRRVLFARPALFGLLAFAPWVWWLAVANRGGMGTTRAEASTFLRLCLLGLCVAALAEPRAVRERDVTSVVFALDVSDSVGRGVESEALELFSGAVAQKPATDEAGLVVFGRNAAVELPPKKSVAFEGVINSQVDRDATNLEQTLSLSAAMIPEENAGRVVLISDGTETEGRMAAEIDQLRGRGIKVDVLPVDYGGGAEVWLERLDLPRFVRQGESYEASVVLSSLEAGSGTLTLTENGEEIARERVEYQAGKNRYSFPIRLRGPGYYEYAATIKADDASDGSPGDGVEDNNTALNYLYLEGAGKVLVVTDPGGDPRDVEDFVAAAREGEREVSVMDGYAFPRDVLSLMPYDLIVFAGVPADSFDARQLAAVRTAVSDMGVGFLMLGGENSFGAGGYQNTPIEEALPVDLDITRRKVLPKGALVIILHTCEFPQGNTWGKRICKRAIKVLGDQDECGVLVADYVEGESWLFELTPAANYPELVPKINAAQIGDMPDFAQTMNAGLKALKESDASAKHMIIISDGDPSPPPPALVKDFADNQIAISTVAVFPHPGDRQSLNTMRGIAAGTGGRFYLPDDPNQLPGIFVKEAKTLRRTLIQNKTVQPEVALGHPILKGLGELPPVRGFVLTTPKEGLTEQILRVPSDEQVAPGEFDPILAVRQFGLGRTGAFTADLGPNWGADWVAWDGYGPFVRQLITHLGRVRKQGHLRMSTYTDGSDGVIVVEDFSPNERFLEITTSVAGPRDRTETVPLVQVGPRRYQARVPLWGKGRYQVIGRSTTVGGGAVEPAETPVPEGPTPQGTVAGANDAIVEEPVENDGTEQVAGGFILPYSAEYLRFRSDPIVLKRVAERTGGRELNLTPETPKSLFTEDRQPKRSSRPIFDWLLILVACLIPLDVAVRRVQLDWALVKGLFKKEKLGTATATAGGPTLEGLLAKKRESSPPMSGAGRALDRGKLRAAPQAAKPHADAPAPPKKSAPPANTTAALLDLKKKRDRS